MRLRPEYPNHVWAYDYVADRTYDGKAYRMLAVIDEFSRECLAIVVGRRMNSSDVLYTLADLFILQEARVLIEQWRRHYNGDAGRILTLRYGWTDHGGLVNGASSKPGAIQKPVLG